MSWTQMFWVLRKPAYYLELAYIKKYSQIENSVYKVIVNCSVGKYELHAVRHSYEFCFFEQQISFHGS